VHYCAHEQACTHQASRRCRAPRHPHHAAARCCRRQGRGSQCTRTQRLHSAKAQPGVLTMHGCNQAQAHAGAHAQQASAWSRYLTLCLQATHKAGHKADAPSTQWLLINDRKHSPGFEVRVNNALAVHVHQCLSNVCSGWQPKHSVKLVGGVQAKDTGLPRSSGAGISVLGCQVRLSSTLCRHAAQSLGCPG
jgi:hypothetical protein